MHYLVIAFRHEVEGLASVLPDFVGVTVKAEDVAKQISALSLLRGLLKH